MATYGCAKHDRTSVVSSATAGSCWLISSSSFSSWRSGLRAWLPRFVWLRTNWCRLHLARLSHAVAGTHNPYSLAMHARLSRASEGSGLMHSERLGHGDRTLSFVHALLANSRFSSSALWAKVRLSRFMQAALRSLNRRFIKSPLSPRSRVEMLAMTAEQPRAAYWLADMRLHSNESSRAASVAATCRRRWCSSTGA